MPPAGLEPATSLVGGAAAENHDLESVLSSRTPLVFGLLIGLGFLLLLVAVGSPREGEAPRCTEDAASDRGAGVSDELQVRHLGDDRFAIDVRGHEIVVDQPVDAGGQDTDPAGLPDHFRRGRFTMTSSSACAAGHR